MTQITFLRLRGQAATASTVGAASKQERDACVLHLRVEIHTAGWLSVRLGEELPAVKNQNFMEGGLGSPHTPSTGSMSKVQESTNWANLHTWAEMPVVQGFGGSSITSQTELSFWIGARLDSGSPKGPDQIYFQPGFRWGQLGAAVEKSWNLGPAAILLCGQLHPHSFL